MAGVQETYLLSLGLSLISARHPLLPIFSEFETWAFHGRRLNPTGLCPMNGTRLPGDSWRQAWGQNLPPERAYSPAKGRGCVRMPALPQDPRRHPIGWIQWWRWTTVPRHRKTDTWLRVWNRRFTLKIPRLGPDRDQLAFRGAQRVATEYFAPPDPAPVPTP